ncbi:site-specific DNA-methyltransferase [Alicyclobacillus ferrooxydans]|uniref:DNA methylase n=1 Tax=Alicyclobacillus ferrooxydans TaxID=471514 RepID=A0A0P9EJB7_9BACL|nr:site-specific DNA-methyltransferase [Alicyclobacillus ferrooxydans]KPV43040.1 DNA methylase [Alicyclobacillus ferrooxydans]
MPTLNFKGKTFVQNHHLTVPYHELIPQPDKSMSEGVRLDDNLILRGDNLVALKALLPMYSEKIKCIFIDPPYNTGTEHWVYNDNVNSPMIQEWFEKSVEKDDLTRHDKWLCMMMPRLQLLRELLCADGVIFVSCDDNEHHHLRMLLDEVFGDSNFITNIVWQKKYAVKSDSEFFSESHDHILVYAKNRDQLKINGLGRTEEQDARYSNPDNDPRGPWTSGPLQRNEVRDYAVFPIVSPTGKSHLPPQGTSWRFTQERMEELISENRIWFGADGNNVPRFKRFLSDVKSSIVPTTWWNYQDAGHNDESRREMKEIFPEAKTLFATPKPTKLLRRILEIATDKDSIVLDSFAGSGTTAHAVLAANRDDGGNRKFILVEMEDYANSITAERVRRVIRGVPDSKDKALQQGLEGTYSYFELGQAIDVNSLISGENLPPYMELARYVFYTATGEAFDAAEVDESRYYIGSSAHYDVYLLYQPELSFLKSMALNLEFAESIGPYGNRKRLVFAPMKYLDEYYLQKYHIEYAQLPYEIYRFKG